jgi:hypothetical protein
VPDSSDEPEKDLWTPLLLAELFLKRVKKVDVKIVMLENAGHYPLEQLGRGQIHEAILSFLKGIEASLYILSRLVSFVAFDILSLLD